MTAPLFRSLSVRNYRIFAGGQAISLTGTWMQRLAQDWLVLRLSHGSGTAVGITTGLQFLPTLLFGLYGGVLADRYPKRTLLLCAQTGMGLTALVLGLLDVTGVVALWQVYALAFLLGLASVLDAPVRQAFVPELVGPALVPNAVSLNSAIFNSARIVGPTIAGAVISLWGTGPAFLANAASYLAVIGGLVLLRSGELHPARLEQPEPGQLRAGLRYVRARPDLLVPIALVGIVGTFGLNFQITMALIATQVFGRGASAYGLLSAGLAIGSLLGALFAAARRKVRLRLVLGAALAFGLLEVLTGLMPTYWTFFALLIPTGAAALTMTTAANAALQGRTSPQMRGRVMALYILVFLGGTPFGAPVIGWLATELGPRSSLLIGGTISALGAIGATIVLARARRVTVIPHLIRRHPHVHVRSVPPKRRAAGYDHIAST
ncbi:MAG: MFS transporter [Frankiaceae bacterium]